MKLLHHLLKDIATTFKNQSGKLYPQTESL